jgi:hypothetical protein
VKVNRRESLDADVACKLRYLTRSGMPQSVSRSKLTSRIEPDLMEEQGGTFGESLRLCGDRGIGDVGNIR